MTVVDVNTGKFTGSGGNLEETVTKNNLEAAEEIVRQLRLRDIGGIIVVDFIDMVLESNRDLVLRRLVECLGRDRTRHQVAEVTSLGLVQMTRKRIGTGLLEAFSENCEHCQGRGVVIQDAPVEPRGADDDVASRRRPPQPWRRGSRPGRHRRRRRRQRQRPGAATPKDVAAMARPRTPTRRTRTPGDGGRTHRRLGPRTGRTQRSEEPRPRTAARGARRAAESTVGGAAGPRRRAPTSRRRRAEPSSGRGAAASRPSRRSRSSRSRSPREPQVEPEPARAEPPEVRSPSREPEPGAVGPAGAAEGRHPHPAPGGQPPGRAAAAPAAAPSAVEAAPRSAASVTRPTDGADRCRAGRARPRTSRAPASSTSRSSEGLPQALTRRPVVLRWPARGSVVLTLGARSACAISVWRLHPSSDLAVVRSVCRAADPDLNAADRRRRPRCTRSCAQAPSSRRLPSATSSRSTRSTTAVGETLTLPVVLVVDGETVTSDAALDKASVTVEVLGATKGPKIIIQKYKNKTGYKKRQGHRQKYTQVKVTDISL